MDRSEDPTIAALAGPPGAASAAPPAAQRGAPDAFRLLYRDTQPRLLRYLHALTGDDAEDIASETWLHIARDLHTFHGNHDASPSLAAPRAAAALGKLPGAGRPAAPRGLRTLARHLDQTPRRRSDANAGVTQPE